MIIIRDTHPDGHIILGTAQEDFLVKYLKWGLESKFSPMTEEEKTHAKNFLRYMGVK